MKKKRIVDLLVLAFLTVFSVAMGFAYAQNAPPAGGQENTIDSRAKDRLEKIEEKLATASSGQKSASKTKAGHFVGTLLRVNATTLLVNTEAGVKTVSTDSKTRFIQIASGKTAISLTSLKAGDRLAIHGINKHESEGSAKLVARLGTKIKRYAVFGRISSLTTSALTLTHIKDEERVLASVNLTSSTVYKTKNEDITFAKLRLGDVVAVSLIVDDKGNFTAKRVFLVPGLGLKEATASASPSAKQ